MFCRQCHYDLRGQLAARCPECGTAFVFADPDTFLPRKPGHLTRILRSFRRRRNLLAVVLTAVLLASWVVAGLNLQSIRYAVHPGVLSTVNLKTILIEWQIQQNDHPGQTAFDLQAARQTMRPTLSPWSEGDSAQYRALTTYALTCAPYFAIPAVLYGITMAILFGGRPRRMALASVAVLCCVSVCSAYPGDVSVFLWPGSHAFLNDYVYISGVDFSRANTRRGKTVAAYDIQSFRRIGRRLIGFADGHVASLSNERAEPLFQAQGIRYPE